MKAASHPPWLRRSGVPLTIVCGPPCSGKTTFVARRRGPSDIVIDLDSIKRGLCPGFRHWEPEVDAALLAEALRVRNAMLASLEGRTTGRAWFIVAAPTEAERQWWQGKLGGYVLLLHPGLEECKRRAIIRDTPLAIAGIDDWERKAREPWPREEAAWHRRAIGLDGWPIELLH